MGSMNPLKCVVPIILNFALISNLLLAQNGMVTDNSTTFLQGDAGDAIIASVAPSIDFGIVDVGSAGNNFTHWCNVVLGPDGRYYFTVGDHNPEGVVMLIAYDPATKTDNICIDSRNIPELADGKWHGRPVINPDNGDMYLIGFYHGDIVYYNIYSKQIEYLGQPVPGQGFEEHIWDWQRNHLYGIGSTGDILVYNTENRSVVFHDNPEDSQTSAEYSWEYRSRLLDRKTGFLYGSDWIDNTILSYDPASNLFHAIQSFLENSLRACSNVKEEDGSFWIFDRSGNVFKFFPDEDRLEPHGKNWNLGAYVTFIERSPGGRYLYYSFAGIQSGMPVVQYDTKTDEKKVIAFLEEYYSEKYNFEPYQFYGGALSQDVSSLFMVSNGTSGNPGMFHIHIPESERTGEPATCLPADQSGNPDNFRLAQNYPNPFNSSTVISYSLSNADFVTLKIYNSVGQEIESLVYSYQSPGTYSKGFIADDFPNGIYFYSLFLNNKLIKTK